MSSQHLQHEQCIDSLIRDAVLSDQEGCFPQACSLVHNGEIISRSRELPGSNKDLFKHAELQILSDCPEYVKDFGKECIFYSVFEPHYAALPLLVDSGLKAFYFGVYREKHSASEFIDKVEYFREMLHYYNSGFKEAEIIHLFSRHMEI